MSKNFVREIDNIKNINKQEFYTNKANDLLSTKDHNYIRKQKREYHCLTDNVKQTKVTNVRYTDTTANPNVNYNLITVDNSQVPKTNTNNISAQSLVSALEAKDQQIQKLENEIATLNGKQPLFHYVAEFAGNQFFNMQTTQTYKFSTIEIFTRIAYSIIFPDDNLTRNFAEVLESGATNFDFNDYDITLKNQYAISGDRGVSVAIDASGKGIDFTALRENIDFVSGEIFIVFKLTKKQQTVAE